jgi:hypothetical protein
MAAGPRSAAQVAAFLQQKELNDIFVAAKMTSAEFALDNGWVNLICPV